MTEPMLTDEQVSEGQRLLTERFASAQAAEDWNYWLEEHEEALLTGYAELQERVKELEKHFDFGHEDEVLDLNNKRRIAERHLMLAEAEIERLETELTTLRGKWEPA